MLELGVSNGYFIMERHVTTRPNHVLLKRHPFVLILDRRRSGPSDEGPAKAGGRFAIFYVVIEVRRVGESHDLRKLGNERLVRRKHTYCQAAHFHRLRKDAGISP